MIRAATAADAAAIAAIYAPEVLHGTATFETEAPDAAEIGARLTRHADRQWPWLVCEADGTLLGYASASQFRDRAAYATTCENSIYVAAAAQRQGVGRDLLLALFDAARAAGFHQMIAVVGDGAGNLASIGLHLAGGFTEVGRLNCVGRKFGRWLDVVYMQKSL